ncbi:MAG: hypothetical protein II694_08410 [Lachnospiraceae bacterium]|nr:hypothetical protein [Lachnospiraceae bacterium]
MDFGKALKFSANEATVEDCYSYLDCDVVIIDRYVPSRLESDKACIAQDELPGGGTVILFEKEYYGTLALRIPSQETIRTTIYINGEEYEYATAPADENSLYALVGGPFEPGCRLKLAIAMPSRTAVIPYNADMRISPVSCNNGTVHLSERRSRFLIRLETPADMVTFNLPEGYDIEIGGKSRGNSAELLIGDNLFTGYKLRIFTEGHSSYRDFDLVVMQAIEEPELDSCAANAYTPITGAFAGEACYVLDRRSSNTENATHGTLEDPMLRIDPVTGYKWGRISPDKADYYFELENGGYEVMASFTSEGARLIANPGTEYEKIMVRDTRTEEQRSGIRIIDGQLVLSVCEGEPEADIMTLTIRAIDTIAVESGYELVYDGRRGDSAPAAADTASEDHGEPYGDEPEDNRNIELDLPTAEDYGDTEPAPEPVSIEAENVGEAELSAYAEEEPEAEDEPRAEEEPQAEAELMTEPVQASGTVTGPAPAFRPAQEPAADKPHEPVSTRTVSLRPAAPQITVSKTASPAEKRREATQTYINTKLAAKKNSDTKKALGIAAGALTVAGAIYALLRRDKK